LLKKNQLEFLLQKSVEIGVKNICLYIAEKSKHSFNYENVKKRMDRYEDIIKSAFLQSENFYLPNLSIVSSIADFNFNKFEKILSNMGINLHVAWRDKPTRRGFSLIDRQGERAITVIGERLAPTHKDNLDWRILKKMDGIFITASDSEIFKMARSASILCTTPRVGLNTINKSNVLLDGLIGSNLDPGEVFSFSDLSLKPKYTIKTEGEKGGILFPGGRYKALKNKKLKVDSYGCGDSFAAGILYGMASKWDIDKSLNLAKVMGRDASEFFGPYANSDGK